MVTAFECREAAGRLDGLPVPPAVVGAEELRTVVEQREDPCVRRPRRRHDVVLVVEKERVFPAVAAIDGPRKSASVGDQEAYAVIAEVEAADVAVRVNDSRTTRPEKCTQARSFQLVPPFDAHREKPLPAG